MASKRRTRRQAAAAVFFWAIAPFCATAQLAPLNAPAAFSLLVLPSYDAIATSSAGAGTLTAEYRFPGARILTVGAEGRLMIASPDRFNTQLSAFDIGGRAGLSFEMGSRITAAVLANGGYSFNSFGTGASVNVPYVGGVVEIGFRVADWLTVAAEGGFRSSFGAYNAFSFGLGTRFGIGPTLDGSGAPARPTRPSPLTRAPGAALPAHAAIEVRELEFGNILPVQYKRYEEEPFGTAVVVNGLDALITDVSFEFHIPRYMDSPSTMEVIAELAAGANTPAAISALFSQDILEVQEGERVVANMAFEYTLDGQRYRGELNENVSILDRNSITWDDDRRVCAFVTAKDPVVLQFAKNVVGWTDSETYQGVDDNLLKAIALHEAVSARGVRYVVDPTTPYIEFSQNESAVDFLQFPRQTFQFGAGDCDDLSTLYNALLESVGIETAFLTIPAHLYMAFRLDTTPAEARERYLRPDELIILDDEQEVWLPVEITERDAGFLAAWQTGAKNWREHRSRDQARMYQTHEAWETYEPVGFREGSAEVDLPDRQTVMTAYRDQVERFIDQQTFAEVARLRDEIRTANNDPRLVNKLGVLYATYGLYERAEEQFRGVLSRLPNDLRSLMNMGNLAFLKPDMVDAGEFYGRANRVRPGHARVILALARTNHELENYGLVRELYAQLQQRDAGLAERFAYLDLRGEEATRAAEVTGLGEVVLWEDE